MRNRTGKETERSTNRDSNAIRTHTDRDEKKDIQDVRSEHQQRGAPDMGKKDTGKHEKDESHGADRNTTKKHGNSI